MKIETTADEASDILDDLNNLDGVWSATYDLRVALEAIASTGGTPPRAHTTPTVDWASTKGLA